MRARFGWAWALPIVLASIPGSAQTPTTDAQRSKPELVPQTGHSDPISGIAASPDGRWLASTSFDGIVNLWEVATGRLVRQFGRVT